MNEIEAKRIVSVLSWASKYHKIPKLVSDSTELSVQCSGIISSSEIRISVGNLFVTVDRATRRGIPSDQKRQFIYAEVTDGSRLQCNLNENNHIISGYVLSGGPSGEISITVDYSKATAQCFGSSTEFEFQE